MRQSKWLFLLGAGVLYAAWYSITGWGVPCPFYSLTGLSCPSCGVTRMCVRLLRLDLSGAYRENPVLFLCLPFLFLLLVGHFVFKDDIWKKRMEPVLLSGALIRKSRPPANGPSAILSGLMHTFISPPIDQDID